MKKTYISLMALLSLGLVVTSCSNDDEVVVNSGPVAGTHIKTFTVTQEGTGVTRTAINDVKIEWQEGDSVTIWDGESNKSGAISQIVATDKTKATIESPVADGAKVFTAVYPKTVGDNCTYSGTAVNDLVIPASQKATLNSYDPAAAIMTAYLDQTNYGDNTTETRPDQLAFTNVCSFIKLTTNRDYQSIKVSVTTGTLSGIYNSADVSASAPEFTYTAGGTVAPADQAVTLTPASGTTIAAGTYYICVAPNASIAGLKVECAVSSTVNDTYLPKADANKLLRNKVYDLGTLGYGVSTTGIINVGGVDGHIAEVDFTGVNGSDTEITGTPTSTIATLYGDAGCTGTVITKVPADGKVYVKAGTTSGDAVISVGGATATVEVVNFAANVYNAESGAAGTVAATSDNVVYLKVTKDGALVTNISAVKYTVTNASIATTDTKGVWKVTCDSGKTYADVKLKVTYEYNSITYPERGSRTFTLLDKQ